MKILGLNVPPELAERTKQTGTERKQNWHRAQTDKGGSMRQPSELMSKNYYGPSKVIPLGQIRNVDGWRFIGIDKNGGKHYCIVRKGDDGRYYMDSNTVVYSELCGWLPDTQATNDAVQGRDNRNP